MKQPRIIQRVSSLSLAVILLITAMWGPVAFVTKRDTAQKVVAGLAKADKAAKPEKATAQLSAKSLEAVVAPAVQLGDSGQTVFLLPAPTLIILLLLSVPLLRHFTLPHFYFSFFRHVFGHHIATNAP
jgi:hypothetical protein